MQAAGSEAERTQAGLIAGQGEGRAADLSVFRRIRSRLHTLGTCNPTLYPVPFIIWTNASYCSWPGRGGSRDSNGATGGGRRGTDSRLRVRR